MNRIVLIGNGFDLAHGMPTSYRDFLDDFWSTTMKEIINSQRQHGASRFENKEILIEDLPFNWTSVYSFESLTNSLKNYGTKIIFKNKFLNIITIKTYLRNWVDIENEFYLQLKTHLNKSNGKPYSIDELNKDFDRIKELLYEYLLKIEREYDENSKTKFSPTIHDKIYSPLDYNDFSEEGFNQKVDSIYNYLDKAKSNLINVPEDDRQHFSKENKMLLLKLNGEDNPIIAIKMLLKSKLATNYIDLTPNEILFLNFNYTSTEKYYNKKKKLENPLDDRDITTKVIHIHGTIDKKNNNPIIFGFGDELDDDYKQLEKLNDNKYLENIKSIKYLETANYKELLEFINKDKFQLLIMGHSCGTSDRTLLNTIFEHTNCQSIKIFYHQIDKINDNYSDIIRNISRNFNDKTSMRDKVVNKTFCEPLL